MKTGRRTGDFQARAQTSARRLLGRGRAIERRPNGIGRVTQNETRRCRRAVREEAAKEIMQADAEGAGRRAEKNDHAQAIYFAEIHRP
jgi:hypothetical protein